MEQLELKPRSVAARRRDPETSHEAAERITASGARDRQARKVMVLVETFPGRTSAELAALSGGGLDRYQVARRLPELKKLGRVYQGMKRLCRATGSTALEWWPRGGA